MPAVPMPKTTRPAGVGAVGVLAAALITALFAAALSAGAARAAARVGLLVVSYHGYTVRVPRSWPVVRLAGDPGACVRFDRHALYLGRPGSDQRCPVQAAGRTEAILVEPLAAAGAAAVGRGALPTPSLAGADAAAGSSARIVDHRAGVIVTATWHASPRTVARALGVRSLGALVRSSRRRPAAAPVARERTASVGRAASTSARSPATPGEVFTGYGFDACSAPSTTVMSDWMSSPFQAVGAYIGGANMACSQPNLTADWVSQVSAEGWHLVPIYVGLQAPGNSCGCAAIKPASAAAEGAAAAQDAVAQAQALGLGSGNPLYFDMEAYSRTNSTTATVLAFLQAWTEDLHQAGYLSGVYGSDNSGVRDLVAAMGTGYVEPDELWIANWNNVQSTDDAEVPPADWANHQRLHQYRGDAKQKYGGATIDEDGDYIDAATAAAGTGAGAAAVPPASTAPAPPATTGAPSITGAPLLGQTVAEVHAPWSGGPSAFAYQWEDCTSDGSTCTPIAGATAATYTVAQTDVGQRLRVLESATNAGGTGGPVGSPLTGLVQATPTSGYWLFTAFGNVFNSPGAGFFGSPAARRRRVSTISGMASTSDGRGYWLAETSGVVLAYGDAARATLLKPSHPITSIVAAPGGGYWLLTAAGNVYNRAGAPFYGSPFHSRLRTSQITGMAPTADGHGYWATSSAGTVLAYGDAAALKPPGAAYPVVGIAADRATGGYWLITSHGNVLGTDGMPFFGSPFASHISLSDVTGMVPTPDDGGYWVVTASGRVFAYGDAPALGSRRVSHPVLGIVGG